MKNRIYTIIALSVVAIIGTSCNDFLDVRPKGIVIPKTCEDYEKLLNFPQLLKASESYPNYLTDDVIILDNGDMATFRELEQPMKNLYTFKSKIYGESEDDFLWEGSYNRIYTYNVIIEDVLSSTEATEEYKRSIRAEALMGRAFEYMVLVNAYANHYDPATASKDPGVPLMLDKNINQTNLQRASVQDVYTQIKKDLDEAEKSLPEKPKINAFRASKAAGLGMLARMYLYMGNYREALKYANLSLKNNKTLINLNNYSVVNPDFSFGRIDVPDRADNPENIYIRTAPWVFGFSCCGYGSDELIDLYDQENDQRFKLYFTSSIWGYSLPKPIWAPWLYANMAMSTPEIYLIAAECEARIGSKDQAMTLLNTLRENRINTPTPLIAKDQEEALKIVLKERRRELALNGCTRLIDLKRLNRDPRFAKSITHKVNNVEYHLKPGDPKYILPIPPKVLLYNPDMTINVR